MTDDQTPDALRVAAIGDLRTWANSPHIFRKRNHSQKSDMSVCEIAETLWNVYLCRSMLYKDFDEFLAECVRLVSLAHMRAARGTR
jgi:hypothetical protein